MNFSEQGAEEGEDEVLMTPQGYERKQKELQDYKHEAYEEIPHKMKQARKQGVVDDSFIQGLQKKQSDFESQIRSIERLLNRATVREKSSRAAGMGHTIMLYDLAEDEEVGPYAIVSTAEVDLESGQISTENPVISEVRERGAGVGDEFTVDTRSGSKRYRIESLE